MFVILLSYFCVLRWAGRFNVDGIGIHVTEILKQIGLTLIGQDTQQ